MSKCIRAILLLLVTTLLMFNCQVSQAEDGVDYGYWCTTCGRQHGPGESCPASGSSGSSSQDEPYDWSQPLEAVQAKAKELDAARDRIIREENRTITRDQKKIFQGTMRAFQAVRVAEPLTTYSCLEARRESDPQLRKKLDQIAAAYWQKSDAANLKAREQALEAMKNEIKR